MVLAHSYFSFSTGDRLDGNLIFRTFMFIFAMFSLFFVYDGGIGWTKSSC
jgi:hypothetical protein